MVRAMLLFERQSDASWLPSTVILSTPKRLQGKAVPGYPNRDARLASIIQNALPPSIDDDTEERGDYEDWIDWGVHNLVDGHTTWATVEVRHGWASLLARRRSAASARRHAAVRPVWGAAVPPRVTRSRLRSGAASRLGSDRRIVGRSGSCRVSRHRRRRRTDPRARTALGTPLHRSQR